jgi:hypothetical protein
MSHPLPTIAMPHAALGDDPSHGNTKARHHGDGPYMKSLFLVATLVTRLAKQFAVLLLGHALAALLDD